tara:strand:- start:423 stop:584 length:162 start_codon:yes stop_codon:yes gene_type:complete
MPILGEHDVLELFAKSIGDWNNLISAVHRQSITRQKAVLNVNHEQYGIAAWLD